MGRQFTLETDHAPLQWMAKDINDRATRWFLELQPYNFVVRHRPGSAHGNTDALYQLHFLFSLTNSSHGSELKGGVCGTMKGMGIGVAEGLSAATWTEPPHLSTGDRCAQFSPMDNGTQFSTVQGRTTFSTRPAEDSATALLNQHTCAGLLVSTPARHSLIN